MSARNRERRAANRERRAAHEAAMRRRAVRQRWMIALAGLVVAAVIAFAVATNLGDNDGGNNEAAAAGAGRECVEVADPIPEGAPDVPVRVGPAPTELVIEDLTVGEGAEVTAGATVTVNYIGVACSTGVIFDESYSSGSPLTFSLNGVIQGWSEGLVGLKVGGRRLLGIPAEMAYGPAGQGDKIGPDEALWFVVDLVDVSQ